VLLRQRGTLPGVAEDLQNEAHDGLSSPKGLRYESIAVSIARHRQMRMPGAAVRPR
jgi:hypothetical protein